MKIKNSQMVSFLNGKADIQNKKLPTKLGYAITKNIKLMNSVAEAYEEERKKILDRYAMKDADGEYVVKEGAYVISDLEAYGAEMQELLEIDNEMDIHMVLFSELEKCDSEQFDALSVQDLCLLEFMTE